jgi:hypothetical protein
VGLIERLICGLVLTKNITSDEEPLFILGHHRSGTTYLQKLILANSEYASPRLYDTVFPDLLILGQWTLRPLLNLILKIHPPFSKLHRQTYDFNFPAEEDVALLNMLCPFSYNWAHIFPKNIEIISKLTISDMKVDSTYFQEWKKAYLQFIKKIKFIFPDKKLALKSPPNMGRAHLLFHLFPKAKFVFIMRNPYDLYPSMRRFWEISDEFSFQEVRSCELDHLIFPETLRLFEKYFEAKQVIPENQLIEIRHEDLVKDPLAILERIHRHLELTPFSQVRDAYDSFIRTHSKVGLERKSLVRIEQTVNRQKVDHHWRRLIAYYNSIR